MKGAETRPVLSAGYATSREAGNWLDWEFSKQGLFPVALNEGRYLAFYWDINRTMSYNALFNFVIGMRGVGKTYGSLKKCLEMFEKSLKQPQRKQFLYVRRYKTELEKLTVMRNGRLFKAVSKEFPNHILKAESNVLYYDDEVCGYAQPLTTASILKSDSFPDVATIIFDEFIIDSSGTYKYLKDEVGKFLDLYETVARSKDVKVFFLSNAVSVANPYFEFFHLDKPKGTDIQRFGKEKDIVVEFTNNPEFSDFKKSSRFGRLISDTSYADYAYDNEWLVDNTDFIEKKTRRADYFVSIRYKDTWLGIYLDRLQYLYYVSTDYDPNFPQKYSATTDDHKPNVLLFATAKQHGFLRSLMQAYDMGCVRYESQTLKIWFRDIMRMTRG